MVAAGLWVLAFLLLLAGTAVALVVEGHGGFVAAMALMAHALLVSAAAATATVRQMFVGQNKLLKAAFKLGREDAEIRHLRP